MRSMASWSNITQNKIPDLKKTTITRWLPFQKFEEVKNQDFLMENSKEDRHGKYPGTKQEG